MQVKPGQQFFLSAFGIALEIVRIEGSTLHCFVGPEILADDQVTLSGVEGTFAVSLEFSELQKNVENQTWCFNDRRHDWSIEDKEIHKAAIYPPLELVSTAA